VRQAMEEVHPLKVPLVVDLGWGADWVAAKEGPPPTTIS